MIGAASLVCAACGWTAGPLQVDPYPFRCPNAGSDDGDHVITTVVHHPARHDAAVPAQHDLNRAESANPFIRYRTSLYSWHLARLHGLSDADYVSIVERVDAAVARLAGTGFRVMPCVRSDRLSEAFEFQGEGGIWVKDETGNVAGSHKARHLMGVALYLEVLRHLGIDSGDARPLAVASCGNAALAAAIIARAIDRRLLVFVPGHASPLIVAQLEQLGADVTRCSRSAGERGDPCYAAFRAALRRGGLPFSCQGNENGLVLEGAKTLVYEMVDQAPATDRIFIQAGGGALASACSQALADCLRAARVMAAPRIHAVQTCGGHPLQRAYDRLADYLLRLLGRSSPRVRTAFDGDDDRAVYLRQAATPVLLDEAVSYARAHRHEFMWPWETEPRSIASGILDDETYDWAVVVEGMLRTGGFPIVVDEPTLEQANLLGREATGIDVDHTGSSGLAGLVALTRSPAGPRPTERVAILFTGIRR